MSELIKLQGLSNTRDLGGMLGADGRKIVKGKLIRSGHLHSATPADIAQLSECIDLVVDFRTERECAEKPDPALPGARLLHLPIFESFAAVLVQTLLGVDRAAIMEDYLRTNDYLAGEVNALCDMVGRMLGGLDERSDRAVHYLFGAVEEYLEAVYEKADTLYGGLDQYISGALGISDEERLLFCSLYLEE